MLRLMVLPVAGLVLMASHSAPPQTQEPAATPEKKICRMIAPIGTIIPKRTCLTKAEWKQLSDASESKNDVYRNRNVFGCGKAYAKSSCTPE